MLVLSRKVGEKVVIGDSISVTLVEIDGRRVKLAFDAPSDVRILRGELAEFQDYSSSRNGGPGRAEPHVRPHLVVSR